MTVIWQTHRWIKPSAAFNLFQEFVICGGFFTVYVTRDQLLYRILEMLRKAREMKQ